MSYPQRIQVEDVVYLFPEMASIGPPTLFLLDEHEKRVVSREVLKGLEHERITDGTLYFDNVTWFLFGSKSSEQSGILRLWIAPSIAGPYREHELSPICIDPRRSRMAGPLLRIENDLYRFGQDFSGGYGSAISVNRVCELASDKFREQTLGTISITGVKGPHTLAVDPGGGYWLDFYEDEFSLLAGFRRAIARLPVSLSINV